MRTYVMKYVLLCLLSLISSAAVYAQQEKFEQWKEAKYANALPKVNLTYLNIDERELIRYINLMRMNPSLFADTYLSHYGKAIDSIQYLKAYNIIKDISPLKPLDVKYQLWQSARAQAKTMAENKGASAGNFGDRIHQFLPGISMAGTSYQYGEKEPILILCKLLLNEESGYLETILSSNLNLIGLSIQPHPNDCFHTVIDLAKGKPNNVRLKQFEEKEKNGTYIGKDECPPGSKVRVRRKLRL